MKSVVLATCDGQRYINEQIDSILDQLATEDELIICDDASTDQTVLEIRKRKDPRLKIVVNPRRLGYIKNFERAVTLARGEYIFFSDQDDVWLPTKLSAMTSALRRKACVVSDAVIVDHNLQELHPSYFKWRQASDFSFAAVFLRPCLIGAAMACRKDYLDKLIPFPTDVPHDFWISLNALWDKNIEIIPDPLILYRRHDGTASISATDLKRKRATIFAERARMAVHLLKYRATRA